MWWAVERRRRTKRERAPHVQRLHMRLMQRPFMQFIVFDGIQCAKASQAKPSQVGPPVVHWPFGRSLKLMQKLFDRFAIRRKNAKQTSGSGG